jgi:hypothetical protein
MTRRPAPKDAASGRGVVAVVLAATFLLLVPAGLVLVWLAATSDVDYWDSLDRILLGGLGLVVSAAFVGLGIGVIRYNVLGLPPVRFEPIGIVIGTHRLSWSEIDWVGRTDTYGVPYLLVDVRRDARGGLPLSARLVSRFSPPLPDGRRPIWITEQMLGSTVEAAIERIEPMLGQR